jgi:hypothetical protein
VHVGERQHLTVGGRPVADHGGYRRHFARIAQPEQIGGTVVWQRAMHAGIVGVALSEGLQHHGEQIRVGAGRAAPEQLSRAVEQAHGTRSRQQRAHQLGVGLHGGFEGHQRRNITDRCSHDVDAVGVSG